MTRGEIEEKVLLKFGQESADCIEGPHRIGEYFITRVWTKDKDGEYHAHYAVEKGYDPLIFENFSPFAAWLTDAFDLDRAAERRLALLRTLIASAVVIAAMALVVYIVYTNPTGAFPLAYVLTAVVGGGAGYLFAANRRNNVSQSPKPD
jgi:hypothetical protein